MSPDDIEGRCGFLMNELGVSPENIASSKKILLRAGNPDNVRRAHFLLTETLGVKPNTTSYMNRVIKNPDRLEGWYEIWKERGWSKDKIISGLGIV